MERKQESTSIYQSELEALATLIPLEIRDAINFKKRCQTIAYHQQNPHKAILKKNQLFTALFASIINGLGETVDLEYPFSNILSGLWGNETDVFSEIQGNLGSKELFISRLKKIHQACNTNKIPANTDLIKVTQKIFNNFNYLKSKADNEKAAEDRGLQNKQKLIELTKSHEQLAEIFNTAFTPFETLEAQDYKALASRDATLKDLMAKRQDLIEAARPFLVKSQNASELTKQNVQLNEFNGKMQVNSKAIALRVSELNNLIAIYNALNTSLVSALESLNTFDPMESKIQRTDSRLIKLKAARQKLIEQSMSVRGTIYDSDELNEKIKQLIDIKDELQVNSSKIIEREEFLETKLQKKRKKPRVAVFMTEEEVADERAWAEKKKQEYKETFEEILKLRQDHAITYAEILEIDKNYPQFASQMNSSYVVNQDFAVKTLRVKHLQLLEKAKNLELAEKDPATLEQLNELQNEKKNLIAANQAIKNLVNELRVNEQKLDKAIVSARKVVEDTKALITNKINTIEPYLALLKNKAPYNSMAVLQTNENGVSRADEIILNQKNIAETLNQYHTVPMQERAKNALESLDNLVDTMNEGFLEIHTQYLKDLAKLRQNVEDLKSLKICTRYNSDCVRKIKALESELEALENSPQNAAQIVDQEAINKLAENVKNTATYINVIVSKMNYRDKSEEMKIVRELIKQISKILNEKRGEICIDHTIKKNDSIITTLTNFRSQLIKVSDDYLDLKDSHDEEIARIDFINDFLTKMQTTFTEDKIHHLTDATNSNIFVDFINFITNLLSSLEPLITNSNKKPVYRAQFWPSSEEAQIAQAATRAHDALSALQTQLGVADEAPKIRNNAE